MISILWIINWIKGTRLTRHYRAMCYIHFSVSAETLWGAGKAQLVKRTTLVNCKCMFTIVDPTRCLRYELSMKPRSLPSVLKVYALSYKWINAFNCFYLGLLRMNELEEDPEFKGRRLVPIDLSVDANPWDNIIKLSIRHVVVDIESKSVHQVLKEVSIFVLKMDNVYLSTPRIIYRYIIQWYIV